MTLVIRSRKGAHDPSDRGPLYYRPVKWLYLQLFALEKERLYSDLKWLRTGLLRSSSWVLVDRDVCTGVLQGSGIKKDLLGLRLRTVTNSLYMGERGNPPPIQDPNSFTACPSARSSVEMAVSISSEVMMSGG